MIGASLVFSTKISKILNNINFIIGIFIIFFISFFNESFNFPDYYSIIPCIGAALVIISGKSANNFSLIVKNKYSILLGKISYTIYMTHWPIFFYKYQKINDLLIIEKLLIISVVIIISFFFLNILKSL